MQLNKEYWNERYSNDNTPWDAGSPTPPLVEIINALSDKTLNVLIPGAGNAHEAKYMYEHGFKNVFVCDWAEKALLNFSKSVPEFPKSHLIQADFFAITQQFDLILEQTFFCALHPGQRQDYVKKTADLLYNKGRLAGLLFADYFPFEGPPFGGNIAEYESLFKEHFKIEKLENCPNSINPRAGSELVFSFLKK